MLNIIEHVVRVNCVICDARSYPNVVCQACEIESHDDFYLLLLISMKDDAASYEHVKSKCIDMHEAIDHHPMITESQEVFDPLIYSVDFQAKRLLENYTDILHRDAIPVNVASDGDCLFHSIHSFYPELSTNEIRARCVDELCLNEQYYTTTVTQMGLDIVDDESVEEHALRILDDQQYAGVLTLAALPSVLMRPIRSVYPHVNDDDQYFEVLNTTFFPRTKSLAKEKDEPLRIMWSGPEQEIGQDWRPNYFVPLLTPRNQTTMSISRQSIDQSVGTSDIRTVQNCNNSFEMRKVYVNEDRQSVDVEVEDDI